MTRSLYITGGAGAGKSTTMARLLSSLGAELGPHVELHTKPLYKPSRDTWSRIALRGHRWPGGVYLGRMRDEYPGTDGLDRACGPALREWLVQGDLPDLIVAEGNLFSKIETLRLFPNLLVLHIPVDPEVQAARLAQRVKPQTLAWAAGTRARALKCVANCQEEGIPTTESYEEALLHCAGL